MQQPALSLHSSTSSSSNQQENNGEVGPNFEEQKEWQECQKKLLMNQSGLDLLVQTINDNNSKKLAAAAKKLPEIESRSEHDLPNGTGMRADHEAMDEGNDDGLLLDEEEDDDDEEEEEEDDEYLDEEQEEEGDEHQHERETAKSNRTVGLNATEEIHMIKGNLLFLNHQMSRLMHALNVTSCTCSHCKLIKQGMPESLPETINQNTESSSILFKKPKPRNMAIENGIEKMDPANKLSINTQRAPSMGRDLATERLSQLLRANLNNNNSIYSVNPETSMNHKDEFCFPARRGRKSKYCSPNEKKAVASYAQIYGASAAARKFNIPPSVAAYYHRKEYKSPKSFNTVFTLPSPMSGNSNFQGHTSISNRKSSTHLYGEDSGSSTNGMCSCDEMKMEAGLDQSMSKRIVNQVRPSDADAEGDPNGAGWGGASQGNPAHSGSPGFLRGRGRGRPKLIGDELDAELVEYMVQVKQANPRQHLTASQALGIARAYILEKSPGLLQEHGGQIKLKITWAMKLVSRIGEREREIQLGLPSGSLQTGNRNNLSNGSFVNDILSQGLPPNTQTPEIVNIRELKLMPSMFSGAGNNCSQNEISGSNAANNEGFDPALLLAELSGNSSEEFPSNELLRGLLQNLKREEELQQQQQQNGGSNGNESTNISSLLSSVVGTQSTEQALLAAQHAASAF